MTHHAEELSTDKKRIYLSPPHIGPEELKLVTGAFASNWIAHWDLMWTALNGNSPTTLEYNIPLRFHPALRPFIWRCGF